MNLLYIWDGRNALPESRRKAIEATLGLYPEARCFCITRLKSFVSNRFEILDWDSLLLRMADHFGFKETPYRWQDPMTFSDWARFYHLAYNPDTLYLDTDCQMLLRYAFDIENKVIHSPNNICLVYSPNNSKAMNILELLRDRKHVGTLMDLLPHFGPTWSKPIPPEYFRHK